MGGPAIGFKTVLAYAVALALAWAGVTRHAGGLLLAAFAVAGAATLLLALKLRELKRAQFIRTYSFPRGLFDKLAERRPELKHKDMSLVARALRQYFLAYLGGGRKFVSMPSMVVDDLWHEFILYTREYQRFCRQAFGGFLHHTPAVVLAPAQRESNTGLRRVWWQACREENLDPRKPARLPLLFALDLKLGIAGGFVYAANCSALRAEGRGDVYCGGDFSDASVDGSVAGFGDAGDSSHGGGHGSDASSGHGDADGGDGGGGDGGGCGGGCGGGGGD